MFAISPPIVPTHKEVRQLTWWCLLLVGFWALCTIPVRTFSRNPIKSDAVEYYSFVTAAFECKDLSFKNQCPQLSWSQTTPEGYTINKRSVGMAYMYTPWYAVAQGISFLRGKADNGYSYTTHYCLIVGIWLYTCIGLWVLGKTLLHFFKKRVVFLTLFLLVMGSHLLWYIIREPLLTHAVNFMWCSILLYATIKYHQFSKLKWVIWIGISTAFLLVIRPINIIFFSIPVLYGITSLQTAGPKIRWVCSRYTHILVLIPCIFIPLIPQFLYWKYATGHWVYYSYLGEKFYWDRPYLLQILFSFRKGWFIYTPLMLGIIPGIILLYKQKNPFLFPTLFLVPLFLYITSCWWAWSYGGCLGMRPLIDMYPLLAVSLGTFFTWAYKKIWKGIITSIFLTSIVALNLFQHYQYDIGILHFDSMTWPLYKSVWLKTTFPPDFLMLRSYPDYALEAQGKGSYYSEKDLANGNAYILKFVNSAYLAPSDSTLQVALNNEVPADRYSFLYNAFEKKYYIYSNHSQAYWRSGDREYIFAGEKEIEKATLFTLKNQGENKFLILDAAGRYLTADNEHGPHLVSIEGAKLPECTVVVQSAP